MKDSTTSLNESDMPDAQSTFEPANELPSLAEPKEKIDPHEFVRYLEFGDKFGVVPDSGNWANRTTNKATAKSSSRCSVL